MLLETRRALALAIAAVAMLALAAPSSLAARGDLEVAARPSYDLSGVQLASNGAGYAVAVWRAPNSRAGVASLLSADRLPGRAWSRPTAVAQVPASRATPLIVKLAVDERGEAHLLWASEPRKGKEEVILLATTRTHRRAWTKPITIGRAAIAGVLGYRVQADLASAQDGTTTVVWCRGGNSDNALDTSNPGTVSTRTASAAGVWGAPQALWTGQFCAGTGLQVDRGGDALASWFNGPVELDDSVLLALGRPAGGAWDAAPHAVTELGTGTADTPTDPYLFADGTVHLFTGTPTNGPPPLRHAVQAAGGATAPAEVVPAPTAGQTAAGWIGGGDRTSSVPASDGANRPVVVFGTAGVPLASGGLGTSALWAATRSEAGPWSTVPVDDLAEASDPAASGDDPGSNVAAGPRGELVATWTSPISQTPCRIGIYRSVRADDGTWSRRMLAGERGGSGGGGSCSTSRAVGAAPPPASLLWTATSRKLIVLAATSRPKAAAAPSVRLLTRSWSAIRKAGAIEFSCRSRLPGACHISVIAAEHDPAVLDGLEGFCRPSVSSALLPAGSRRGTIRFPLAEGCYDSGPRPKLRRAALRFSVLAVGDSVGHRSGARRVSIRIRGSR